VSIRRYLHRRRLLLENAWFRWCLRHGRKSELQRDWESGDPARVARVEAVAAQIRDEIAKELETYR
jgi:hypothetical protein